MKNKEVLSKQELELAQIVYISQKMRMKEAIYSGLKYLIVCMMVNSLNVMAVRMQSVDYQHNRSLRKATRDLIVNDRHRAFYKGLFPQLLAFGHMMDSSSIMKITNRSQNPYVRHSWPMIFFGSTLVIHPLLVISM